MSTVIPNPLRIACTECHRDMHVEYQSNEPASDSVIIAAECDCGRLIGAIDGILISRSVRGSRPMIAEDIRPDLDVGTFAKERIADCRAHIAKYERWITAATWASERPRKGPPK